MSHVVPAWTRTLLAAAVAVTAISAVGCGPPKYTDYEDFLKTPRPIVAGKPYVIEPPDTIQVVAPSAPEIHQTSLQLRPDGYITLHLVGDIFAAGKTPTQLAAEIEERILKYYQDVSVQVQVIGFNSKFYYMAGETSQGPRGYSGRDTVFHAVMAAGGISPSAWPEKAVVIRPNERAELIRRMSVDLRDMIETGDFKHNAVLEEGDIIWIPINPFAAIGRVVQNLLAPVDPLIRAAGTPGVIPQRLERSYEQGYGGGGGGFGY